MNMWLQKPPLGTPLDWEDPLNKGLVMNLAMNEGHGDVVRDLSLYGNHGTLNGFAHPPTVASGWNPGQTGVGLNFDGSDDYIDCGNDPSMNPADEVTVSAWTKINNTKQQYIVTNWFTDNGGYVLASDNDAPHTKWRFKVNNGGSLMDRFSNIDLVTDTWYNIVGTFDRGDIHIYINGGLCDGATNGNVLQISPSLVSTKIGHHATTYFDGHIDQTRIMNRTWTAKEVMDYAINPWQVYLDEDD